MFSEAVDKATVDAGVPKKDIQAAFIGSFIPEMLVHQGHTAPLLMDFAGMKGIPATRHEDACASGATALRAAVMAIESGMYDTVLVAGVEKMTSVSTNMATEALAAAADDEFESSMGLTFPGVFGIAAECFNKSICSVPEGNFTRESDDSPLHCMASQAL
jgi:acetyl-CoA C-acetyltransferase